MFIIVNDRPVDVFKIKNITGLLKIEERTYKALLSIYGRWCKKQYGKDWEATLVNLLKDFKGTHKTDYRFFHTYLSRLDDMIKSAGDAHGIFDVTGTRLKHTEEIKWNQLPDIYFFGITNYEEGIFKGKLATDDQLFSSFYESKEEANKALEKLISAINTVRFDALRITI